MRKPFLHFLVFLSIIYTVNAQNNGQTEKGSWLLEANTGFGGGDFAVANSANTGFGLSVIDGTTLWSIGAEGGYFISEDLALKIGLGYTDTDGLSIFSYKVGAKYYVNGKVPFQIDVTGANADFFGENPFWLGFQGGYAIFIGEHVSIEPGLRYNLSLNKDFSDSGIFEFRVGFVIHL